MTYCQQKNIWLATYYMSRCGLYIALWKEKWLTTSKFLQVMTQQFLKVSWIFQYRQTDTDRKSVSRSSSTDCKRICLSVYEIATCISFWGLKCFHAFSASVVRRWCHPSHVYLLKEWKDVTNGQKCNLFRILKEKILERRLRPLSLRLIRIYLQIVKAR